VITAMHITIGRFHDHTTHSLRTHFADAGDRAAP